METQVTNWTPSYSHWRHGGWYVHNVRHPSGGCGCVSNNFTDKKWRIISGTPHDATFSTRGDAAQAERLICIEKAKFADLLTALQNLAECGDQDHDEDYTRTCSIDDPQNCALCGARAAIQKAEATQ